MKQSNNNGLTFTSELFGAFITKKQYPEAWENANGFWSGSIRKRQKVLYAMLTEVLANQKLILTNMVKGSKEVET